MPNPKSRPGTFPDVPLDLHLGYATHIRIECQAPLGGGRHCSYSVTLMTSELYERAPGAATYKDFVRRLRCDRCTLRGWASISAIGRG
ncbi:hypothetical protein P1X14_18975 [Sphingomonas sp. AOB5]|uniref:hypothetical protein n=1 Tax=Sphingomonas sp. AOB5 TaxID=3034017 RepID=UPI0023F892B6|nr:hypothetical protein [Sphingomonas sp. AOB5]MDF7777349.1 hypothetical protein [Sphingomonas sp. AOB5]